MSDLTVSIDTSDLLDAIRREIRESSSHPQITLTTRSAAKALDVSPETLRSWVSRGLIKPVLREKRIMLFAVADLERFARGEP